MGISVAGATHSRPAPGLPAAPGERRRPCSLRPRVSRTENPPPLRFGGQAEGARDAKGPGRTQVYAVCANKKRSDPRASAPRDTEACRSPNCRKSAQSQGVPRAVFEGLLCIAPGGLTFQAPSLSARAPIHRCGPTRPSGARLARRDHAAWAAGSSRRISDAEGVVPRPPLPAPHLKMLYRHPSVTRAGYRDIIL
jgi:hypothetical protein